MPSPVLVPAAEADIDEALCNTLTRWGHDKYEQYLALIEEALNARGQSVVGPAEASNPSASSGLSPGQTWTARTTPIRLRDCR
jgi:hypothetical protein